MKTPTMFPLQITAARPKHIQSLLLCLLIIAGFLFLQHNHKRSAFIFANRYNIPAYHDASANIAKVSMLYGKPNRLYQRAVKSHERHAALHGYPMHILRNQVARDFWNKPSYLMSVLLRELEKDPGDRIEWLMWFDADSVILSTELSVSIFLPPHDQEFNKAFDNKHLLVTKDFNGLNTGVFFIRVHEWSVRFLSKTMAYAACHPEVELGYSADQRAMELLINDTESQPHTTFIPRQWINTYVDEAQPGHLLVHFAGLVEREWYMKHFLSLVEGPRRDEWIRSVEKTEHHQGIMSFWRKLRDCDLFADNLARTISETYDDDKHREDVFLGTLEAVDHFKKACWYRSDEEDKLANARKDAELAVEALIGQAR